jgi:16S rRNA processing protein RimM
VSAGAGDPNVSGEGTTSTNVVGASLQAPSEKASSGEDGLRAVPAGRVGRAHGLDGSFYVTGARPRLLAVGTTVKLDGRICTILRRAGTDEHPIERLEEVQDRPAAEALRGRGLTVELAQTPALEEGEWWAQELMGCEVVDGKRRVGTVVGLMELPSCEALEVRLGASGPDGQHEPAASSKGELLVPMVRDAIRHVDPKLRRIDVNMAFLEDY